MAKRRSIESELAEIIERLTTATSQEGSRQMTEPYQQVNPLEHEDILRLMLASLSGRSRKRGARRRDLESEIRAVMNLGDAVVRRK